MPEQITAHYTQDDYLIELCFNAFEKHFKQTLVFIIAAYTQCPITKERVEEVAFIRNRKVNLPKKRVSHTADGLPTRKLRSSVEFLVVCDNPQIASQIEMFTFQLGKALCERCRFIACEVEFSLIVQSCGERHCFLHSPEDECR